VLPVADTDATDHPVVDSLSTSWYVFPTDAPEGDGTLTWDETTMVLAEARAGGVTGTGWTYGPPACASVIDETLAAQVLGRSGIDVAGAHEAMVRAVRNQGRRGVVSMAISAVDIALWDLAARLLELPLHHLLGVVHDQVPVYGSGGFTTYDAHQLDAQLDAWLAQAIPRAKIKIGESWGTAEDRDLARMRQVRERVGADVALMVDANGGYTAKQAVRVMRRADDLAVSWFEEPVSSDDLAGLRLVRESVAADVAAGEYGFDPFDLARLCQAGAVDCLQIVASRCGGITEWRRAAAVAATFGLEVSGHCAPHLHAHVAAATPNLRHLEWFRDHLRIESQCFDGVLDPTGGTIEPDDAAIGHGLTVRRADIAEFRKGDDHASL
jgi:L-alanine-DL-glutamate epimerase-like enolase superfamily enzyme